MGKKNTMGVFLLVMLILVNVVIGGVLLFFIQNIHIPKIDVTLNLSQITTDELNFSVRISMDNDNHFDLIAKNLNIIGKTPDGNTIMDLRIPGGTVQQCANESLPPIQQYRLMENFPRGFIVPYKGYLG